MVLLNYRFAGHGATINLPGLPQNFQNKLINVTYERQIFI